jgi:lysophospholipase L1-like esterase
MIMPAWLIGALALGALVILSAAQRGSTGPSTIRVQGPVALIGDSIAVGLSGPLGELMRTLGLTFFWNAEQGTNARQWVQRIDSVLARRPRTVFINLGGNDAASAALTSEFAQNIKRIVEKTRAAGAQPILLEPPSRPSSSFAVIQQGLRSTGAPVLVPSPAIPRAADGVHFTGAGYQMWAEDIAEMLTAV